MDEKNAGPVWDRGAGLSGDNAGGCSGMGECEGVSLWGVSFAFALRCEAKCTTHEWFDYVLCLFESIL